MKYATTRGEAVSDENANSQRKPGLQVFFNERATGAAPL
jgi:hypothetical protein